MTVALISRLFLLMSISALVLLSCLRGVPHRINHLTDGLRCGMSEAQVRELARELGDLEVHRPEDARDRLVAKTNGTSIVVELSAGSVEKYQVSWPKGFMKRVYELKRDVCDQELLVELHVVGRSLPAVAATVTLDGRQVGELTNVGSLTFDVPLGKHELAVLWPNGDAWTEVLGYDENSGGYDTVVVEPH